MPEIASRLHCENITVCLKEALEQSHLKFEDMDAFAVTRGPGLIGCLHVGLQAAKTLAMIYDKPLIPVHHLAGHIYANQYAGEFKYPLLCVVVSGGNTQLVIMFSFFPLSLLHHDGDSLSAEASLLFLFKASARYFKGQGLKGKKNLFKAGFAGDFRRWRD